MSAMNVSMPESAIPASPVPARESSIVSGEPLLEIINLKKYFPVQKGFLRRRWAMLKLLMASA